MSDFRIGCLNQNLSGHASFHRELVEAVARQPGVAIRSKNVPQHKGLFWRAATNPWPLPEGWDMDLALFRKQLADSLVSRSLVRELAGWSDVVHFYTQNACALPGRHLGETPFVFTTDATAAQTIQHFGFRYPGYGSAMSTAASTWIEKRFASRAAEIIVQSEWARDGFLRDLGIPADRIHVVHLGAPRPFAAVDRTGREGRPVRVIFVGASMSRKGGHALIEALVERLGSGVELHLVTREDVAPQRGVIVHNDVVPGDGKIEQLMAAADVFALPTDMDMTPNAILEAMASGLPVVAYDNGGIAEIVRDGVNGFVTEIGDVAALRHALSKLIESRDLRLEMGQQGRERLIREFDPDAGAARWVEILRSAAGRQRTA